LTQLNPREGILVFCGGKKQTRAPSLDEALCSNFPNCLSCCAHEGRLLRIVSEETIRDVDYETAILIDVLGAGIAPKHPRESSDFLGLASVSDI
jgi:hypothetical protein